MQEQINTLAEAAESGDHEALAEFAERAERNSVEERLERAFSTIRQIVCERPVPECGTEGVLREGDLNPVPIAGDEPLPMTWEQECERLRKRCSEYGQALVEARASREGAINGRRQLERERDAERERLEYAIRRAEAAEKQRDEALEKLSDWGIVTKPPWAVSQSEVGDWPEASVSDPEYRAAQERKNREAKEWADEAIKAATSVSDADTGPQHLVTVHRPDAPRCEFHADEWVAEDGNLVIYRAGEEVAEFPAHEWRFVEAGRVESAPNDDMENRRFVAHSPDDEIAVTLEPGQVVKINGMPFRIATENAMAIGTQGNAQIAGLVDSDQHDIGRKGRERLRRHLPPPPA